MTTISTNTFTAAKLQGRTFGARLMDLMVRMAESHPKYREAQHLASLSDDQLATLGMTRGDIPARVYGSRFM